MKSEIRKLTESEMLKCYPIKRETIGWYFRRTETSNNAWLIEGSDVWGRTIFIHGSDPEALSTAAEKQASRINEVTKKT